MLRSGRVSVTRMMRFMLRKALSMEACVAWSTGEHAVAAACDLSDDASYPLARKLLQDTLLGVAAVCQRDTGWQSPAPIDVGGTLAGMQGYAERRTEYEKDYENATDYFYYTSKGRRPGVHSVNDGLNQYDFKLSYWLVMHLLPLPVINFCDDRGRHSAFSRLNNWSTADFAVRAALFTCSEAIKMMDLMVVEPWKTGAGTYTDKPLFFIDSSSVGEGARIKAMVAYLPEDNDPNAIQAALKVMAVVYKRSDLAPEHMSTYQVFLAMRDLAGFGGTTARKNITLASSTSQLIAECFQQLVTGGGKIVTTLIPPGEEGGPRVDVKITAAPAEKICELWNDPDARKKADDAALRRFAALHYPSGAVPSWQGGVPIVPDDGAGETSGKSGGDDTAEEVEASPPSEVELTPALIETCFQTLSLYGATDEAQREEALTAVGAGVDALVRKDPTAARRLYLELKRARNKGRSDGPADLSEIWNVVPRPSWDPASRGFLARALKLRKGLKMAPVEVPELRDDDGDLIYDASTSTGFQKLLNQYSTDEGAGMARASLQRTQKDLAGSLEAMYPREADGAAPASVVVGDRVDAYYDKKPDEGWYAATVTSVDADASTCAVHYDDGDDASRPLQLIRKRVRAPDVEFAAGDRVHADWKGNGKYSGATVKRPRRGAYDLEFDDGYSEPSVHADRVWP